jgi:hypothetical protein
MPFLYLLYHSLMFWTIPIWLILFPIILVALIWLTSGVTGVGAALDSEQLDRDEAVCGWQERSSMHTALLGETMKTILCHETSRSDTSRSQGYLSFLPSRLSTGFAWTLVRLSMTCLTWLIPTQYDSIWTADSLWLLYTMTSCATRYDSCWLRIHVYKTPSSQRPSLKLDLLCNTGHLYFTKPRTRCAYKDALGQLFSHLLSSIRYTCKYLLTVTWLFVTHHSKPRTHDVSPDTVACQWHIERWGDLT